MLVLSSSPIAWMGAESGQFTMIGYSLGGGICAAFASYFPHLLSALILLAPSGLIRNSQISFQSRLLYSHGLVPEKVLGFLVGRRLRAGPLLRPKPEDHEKNKLTATDAITEELPSESMQNRSAAEVLSRAYPNITVPGAVRWQVHNHSGFVHAFMSSMRYGPILKQRQWHSWARLGRHLSMQRDASPEEERQNGLPHDRVLIMCGSKDAIIVKEELVEDAIAALEENVQFRFFNAGHEFPSTRYEEVAQQVWEFLNS